MICQDAAVVGALALLPVPLLDAWLQGRVLEALYVRLGKAHNTPLAPETIHALTGFRGSYLLGCLSGVVWWPIKKLFRKIIYVFAIKDAFDGVADAGLRAEMVRRALVAGALPTKVEGVRTLMDRCLREHGGSPVWGAVGGQPAVDCLEGGGAVSKGVAALVQRGKGAAVLARFDEGLAVLPEDGVDPPGGPSEAAAGPGSAQPTTQSGAPAESR
jgi:hypothetical protein